MVGVWSYIIDPSFFFRSLKGHCHGTQFLGQNRQNQPTYFH